MEDVVDVKPAFLSSEAMDLESPNGIDDEEGLELSMEGVDALLDNSGGKYASGESREYPCPLCSLLFKSRQQRHYHLKIARKCPGLQGLDPEALRKLEPRKTIKGETKELHPEIAPSSKYPAAASNSDLRPTPKLKSDISLIKEKMALSLGNRRHPCPKCGKSFGKPSHVKRHLFTCRGPGFVRTSPHKMLSQRHGSASGGGKAQRQIASDAEGRPAAHRSPSRPDTARRRTQQSKPRYGQKLVSRQSKETQSNDLGFPIDNMEDLRTVLPLFLTIEGWTYNLLDDGIAMIRSILDVDTLECHWSKTVLIRSTLKPGDSNTFEVIIKSKVPGYDLTMLEEQSTKLTCVADVFEVMGIPLVEEDEDEEDAKPSTLKPTVVKPSVVKREPASTTPFPNSGYPSTFRQSPAARPRDFNASFVPAVVADNVVDEDDDATDEDIGDDRVETPVDVHSPAIAPKVKNRERVCRVCGMSGFPHRQALYRHIKKSHPNNQSWFCPICNDGFSCQNTFLDHYDTHRSQCDPDTLESEASSFERGTIEQTVEEEGQGNEEEEPMSDPVVCPVVEDIPPSDDGLLSTQDDESRAKNAGDNGSTTKRRRACGDCPPCRITENCEECTACKTRATSKQKCERRKCLNMTLTKAEETPQYEVKQLLFAEWALQKTLNQPESVNEVVKNEPVKPEPKTKPTKTFWRCKLCSLTFHSKDKSVVLSHVATCHRDCFAHNQKGML